MKLWPLATLVLAACTSSGNAMEGYAPESVFHYEIDNCSLGGGCAPLCVKLFGVDPADLSSCKIIARDPGGARVRGVLIDDDGDVVIDTSDDGSDGPVDDPPPDDGCTDGSCDPPPDDGCTDGSCDPPADPPPDDGSTAPRRIR